jgi:P-type E1-E2 ATPase
MASIKGMLPSDVLVLRDSAYKKVPAKDLVPGDFITISMGEKVPADVRLIEVSSDLQFDRSVLTGEVWFWFGCKPFRMKTNCGYRVNQFLGERT